MISSSATRALRLALASLSVTGSFWFHVPSVFSQLQARAERESISTGRIRIGIDILQDDHFSALADCSVGLITNHTGRASDGTSTSILLHRAEKVHLVRLFSPEHGLRGTAENGVAVDQSRDPETGLPTVSLYARETRKPRPEDLADLDTLVFDIQDCGTRFYTYIATMFLAMDAAAEAEIRFVVLDRPNPIRADRVEGPLPDAGTKRSLVCPHPLPIRHGLTVGELAGLYQAEAGLTKLDLSVIKMTHYRRAMWFDETGLPWTPPSPNLPTLATATVYPGIAILEFLNLSVGRGTDAPFLTLGAPFLAGEHLARHLTSSEFPGVRFSPIHFTPSKSIFANQTCRGIRIQITDRDLCMPLEIAMEIAHYLAREHRVESHFEAKANVLLLHSKTLEALLLNQPIAPWNADRAAFMQRRKRFLLYPM